MMCRQKRIPPFLSLSLSLPFLSPLSIPLYLSSPPPLSPPLSPTSLSSPSLSSLSLSLPFFLSLFLSLSYSSTSRSLWEGVQERPERGGEGGATAVSTDNNDQRVTGTKNRAGSEPNKGVNAPVLRGDHQSTPCRARGGAGRANGWLAVWRPFFK